MSRRLTRISLLFALLLSSEVWAIGLGDIKLDSALNEPLRADIILLGATPEEISGLNVELASADDFARYGIDRPFYLQELEFNVVNRGVADSVVQIRSRSPMTEPFLTFLVEATWPSGRLLREYTVLLDPPTYTPPGVQQAPAVQAPVRQAPRDSAPIERQPPPRQEEPVQRSQPQPLPAQPPRTETPRTESPATSEPKPLPPRQGTTYDTTSGGDVYVNSGDTLWGIASRMRPDSRLSMNQTMLAIFEANRDAFDNNINRLSAGTTLRIPSANDVFQISRGEAFNEVKRQNALAGYDESSGTVAGTPTDTGTDVDYSEPADTDYSEPADSTTRPSLTLVPPDEEQDATLYDDDTSVSEPYSREQEIEDRIADLEAADVPDQQSLIEIRDNELAALRQELADLRGEEYIPPAEDPADDPFADAADDEMADEVPADDALSADADDDAAVDDEATTETPASVVRTQPSDEGEGIVDTILGYLTSIWALIGVAVLAVIGLLIWFMRRGDGGDDYESDRPWESLDGDASATGTFTQSIEAPTPDEAIVVVEQDSGVHPVIEDETIESETPAFAPAEPAASDETTQFGSLEDTFSSETAVNLDQTDPIAEADFHMAYGLYDQAADLINGALESDPTDKGLMSKLCEIYFVWGNRDAFVDAATRLKSAVGDGISAEWDKIVIMGQQIAADHDLFAGAEIAGATRAVDLAFDDDGGDATGALDMDFGADDGADSDIVDLGADDGADADIVDLGADDDAAQGVDFLFDDENTAESPTIEAGTDATAEMPAPTVETPTIEEQFEGLDGTSELPSLDMELGQAISDSGQDADATAEINLDELDLNIPDDDATELASLDDLDATGTNEALDPVEATGKNPEVDPNETGVREALDFDDLVDTGGGATGLHLAADETGQNPAMTPADDESSGVGIDDSLLDATGLTQVLTDDMAVETGTISEDDATMLAPGLGDDDTIESLPDDAETLLAPMDDDGDDFDFAKTEALPPEAFTGNADLDATAESPAIAETDVDLDLDDLTAALQVSEIGDTVEQPRDDATVEQPRPEPPEETAELPTMSLGPDDMSDDLNEARTMTEVGTKLDLARAYVDMGDPAGARSILEEVLDEGDDAQRQQAQQLLDSLS